MEKVKSVCGLCPAGCGILVQVGKGKVLTVTGNPESPINKGLLCKKGLASLEYLYHPNRLKHPLRRVGERGEGKWQRVSWDEALDTIAHELTNARDNRGAESVAFVMGAVKGLQDTAIARLASTYGTPNFATVGNTCYVPSRLASQVTCGFMPTPDYEYPPSCIVIWGSNMAETRIAEHEQILSAVKRGSGLVVIDPRRTEIATGADLWLQIRPGSDLALALAMINVIVNEGLFDKPFVDKWTVGLEELRLHVQDYPPQKVEEITWVPAETIRKAARFYATRKPAVIPWGNALEQNANGVQAGRAIAILRAITGNLDVPGGEIETSSIGIPWWNDPGLTLVFQLPKSKWEKRVDVSLKFWPTYPRVSFDSVKKAILEEDPYPINAAYIQGNNTLLTFNNARETYKALRKLNFLAVADLFMTPTAELADIVLPAASYLEFDSVSFPWYYPRATAQVMQKVAQIGECQSDLEIICGLAKRMGLAKYFWDSTESFLDYYLKPSGLTFREFRKVGMILGGVQYRKYEKDGFKTPSHKVELYSERLKNWGFDPLPVFRELPETAAGSPELKEYPLILTSFKPEPFRHSDGKQIPTLRRSHPEPILGIHPEAAANLGINEGDWVYIETKIGRIKQKANLTSIVDPRVVIADYGWWFPEKGAAELYGWAESNINILTDGKPPFGRELGTPNLKGILCRVYKA